MLSRRKFLSLSGVSIGASAIASTVGAEGAQHDPRPHGLQEARFWEATTEGVRCDLCPWQCVLKEGQTGRCRNRRNTGGRLEALGYGQVAAELVSLIQHKPIYHTLPDVPVYSFAVAGCSFACLNCRNFAVSQAGPLDVRNRLSTPGGIVDAARREKCRVIAYTFSEPTVWYEFMYDTAVRARDAGLKNLLVTNGNINPGPLKALLPFIDMVNVDIKSLDEQVYVSLNHGRLQPVLDTVRVLRESGVWFEVNHLVIPSWTDDHAGIDGLCAWIAANLGTEVPLHFSQFLPRYQLARVPTTPVATLVEARRLARARGIKYVYIHNEETIDNDTTCPGCGTVLIHRTGDSTRVQDLSRNACARCGLPIPGFWLV